MLPVIFAVVYNYFNEHYSTTAKNSELFSYTLSPFYLGNTEKQDIHASAGARGKQKHSEPNPIQY